MTVLRPSPGEGESVNFSVVGLLWDPGMAASLCSQTKSCTSNVIVAQNMTCRKFRLRAVGSRVASTKMDVMGLSCRIDSIAVSVFVNIG